MRYSLNYRGIIFVLLTLMTLSGCYHNSEYEPPKIAAPRKAFCEQTPKPVRCTDEASTFKDWGQAGQIIHMIFDDQSVSDGDKDLNSFKKSAEPLAAHRRYFDRIQTDKYGIVFELLGFDPDSTEESQDIYLAQWSATAPYRSDKGRVWLFNNSASPIPEQIYSAKVTKRKDQYQNKDTLHLTTTPQKVIIPTSTEDPNSPPLVFEDAVINLKFKVDTRGPVGSVTEPYIDFEGTIKGILTKESHIKAVLYDAVNECNTSCIKKVEGTTCEISSTPEACRTAMCTEIMNFCLAGEGRLNAGFNYTVNRKPYAGATASLKITGEGVSIIGIKK